MTQLLCMSCAFISSCVGNWIGWTATAAVWLVAPAAAAAADGSGEAISQSDRALSGNCY
jgi:hypothetical protein